MEKGKNNRFILLKSKENSFIWTKIGGQNSMKRAYHASIVYHDLIIIFGGKNGHAIDLNDIIAFELHNLTWSRIIPKGMIPKARSSHTMCLTPNDNILVYGGQNSTEKALNEIGLMALNLSEEGKNPFNEEIIKRKGIYIDWEVIESKSSITPFRASHTAHTYDNLMYVFGGTDEKNRDNNDIWCLNIDTFTWNKCLASGDRPSKFRELIVIKYLDARVDHCSVLFEHKIYVFGGFSIEQKKYLNDFYVFNIHNSVWQKIVAKGIEPSPRGGASVQEIQGRLFIFGGYKEEMFDYSDELFLYSFNDNIWEQIPKTEQSPTCRGFHTLVRYKKNLFVVGGVNYSEYFSDLYSVCAHKANSMVKKTLKPHINNSFLKDLFMDNSFADVIIQVENEEFPAHKVILARRCKYFRNMFLSGMIESSSKKISFSEIRPNTFKVLLGFIYGYELTDIDEELAVELLELSDKYMLPDLKQEVEQFLSGILNHINFEKIAMCAEKFETFFLKETILEFVQKNSLNPLVSNHK